MEKEISQAVIRRMPRYYRYLGELLEEGVERISSNDLSHRRVHGHCKGKHWQKISENKGCLHTQLQRLQRFRNF